MTPPSPLELAVEALKPFAAVAGLMQQLVDANPERWPDDKPNSEFIPGAWPDWGDFRRAASALAAIRQEGVSSEIGDDPDTDAHDSADAAAFGIAHLHGADTLGGDDKVSTELLVRRGREMARIARTGKMGHLTQPYAAILLDALADRLAAPGWRPTHRQVKHALQNAFSWRGVEWFDQLHGAVLAVLALKPPPPTDEMR